MIDAPNCTKTANQLTISADAEKTNRVVQFFIGGLERGIEPIHSVSPQNINKFGHFCFDILMQLVSDENITCIHATEGLYNFALNETENGVELTCNGITGKTHYAHRKDLQVFLFNNIFNHPDKYPKDIIKSILRYLMNDGINKDTQITMRAVLYILECRDFDIASEFKTAAVEHVFQHDQPYEDKIIFDVAGSFILHAGCLNTKNGHTARYILDNEAKFCPLTVRSACIYIVYCARDLSIASFNCAAQYIGQHHQHFPKKVVIQAAMGLIRNNPSFFSFSIQKNNEYKAFFERYNAMGILID